MPRTSGPDGPMVRLDTLVPKSTRAELEARADAAGVTLAVTVRAHLDYALAHTPDEINQPDPEGPVPT